MSTILPGVVLAAGRSRRMGRPKALLPVLPTGEAFITRIVRVMLDGEVDDVVVVAGREAASLAEAVHIFGPRVRLVVNPEPDRGQLSSLLLGLTAIDRPGVGGMMVTLVDVPLIDPGTVRRLRRAHAGTRAPIVRPVRAGRHGHPVVFDRVVFDELRNADPADGAKPVVRAHAAEGVEVPVDVEGPFLDIDTPAAYAETFGRALADE